MGFRRSIRTWKQAFSARTKVANALLSLNLPLILSRKIARLRGEKLGMIFAGGRSTYAITSDGTMNFAFDFKPLVNSKSYCDITFTIKVQRHAHTVILTSTLFHRTAKFVRIVPLFKGAVESSQN